MGPLKPLIRILVCAAIPVVAVACGGSTSPTTPPAASACTFTVTITSLNNTPLPAQGTRYEFFFASTVVGAAAAVYVVDVNAAPAGCSTAWTAVSANTSAVQLSPAGGTAGGRVELFLPPNTGAPRATAVTIAGQAATITQSGP